MKHKKRKYKVGDRVRIQGTAVIEKFYMTTCGKEAVIVVDQEFDNAFFVDELKLL